jgi:hypothetical protein
MQTFSDKAGRVWRLDLSFALWQTIKAETSIDLLDVAMPDSQSLAKLADIRTGLIGVVLWLYVEDQATAAGVDRETFWKALDGTAINAATVALVRDLEDFSQSHPQMMTLRVAMEEALQALDRGSEEMRNREAEIRQKCRSLLSTPGSSPSDSPASSDAILAPGASAISSSPVKDDDVTPGSVQV